MDEMTRVRLKDALQRYVAGHVAAAQVIAEEEAERLARLRVEESRAEFESLCALWEANRDRNGLALVAQARVEELVALRRRLDLAGSRRAT
jgi:hypothetical protein